MKDKFKKIWARICSRCAIFRNNVRKHKFRFACICIVAVVWLVIFIVGVVYNSRSSDYSSNPETVSSQSSVSTPLVVSRDTPPPVIPPPFDVDYSAYPDTPNFYFNPRSTYVMTYEDFYTLLHAHSISIDGYMYFGRRSYYLDSFLCSLSDEGISLTFYSLSKPLLVFNGTDDQVNQLVRFDCDHPSSSTYLCFFSLGLDLSYRKIISNLVDYSPLYSFGYNFGYNNGYNSSTAYSDGFNAGYSSGYNVGLSEQFIHPISAILDPVHSFMSTNLFGSFSIGSAFTVALFVMVAIMFIKMFSGG